ncbi:MAG: hypothetical protein WKF78_15230 [Candidatus Limnocylindrales bacterium]
MSDDEVTAVTKHWLDQAAGRTFYETSILEFAEIGGGRWGSVLLARGAGRGRDDAGRRQSW